MSKLPPRFNAVAMPLVLSGLMTIIVSGISTINAIGFAPGWGGKWFGAWLLSWAVAFPVMVFVLPIARRIVANFVEAPPMPGASRKI